MPRKKKSLIPPEKQIPFAIVLGILFAIILVWRFAPQKGAETELPTGSMIAEEEKFTIYHQISTDKD